MSGNRISYRINEAASAVGVSPMTIRRLIQAGQLRTSRVGRSVLIPATELERLVEHGTA